MFKYLFLLISCLGFSQNTMTYTMTSEEYDILRKKKDAQNQEAVNEIHEEVRKKYEKVEKFHPHLDAYFLVTKNKKQGIIDKEGKTIVPIYSEFVEIKTFCNNLTAKTDFYFVGSTLNVFPYQYYTKDGKLLFESYFYYRKATENGRFIKVWTKDQKIKIYDFQLQKFIINKNYNKTDGYFSSGMLKVERNGIHYLLSEAGKENKTK